MALLVCAVSAFTFSDRLASDYEAHWNSTLACDIGLSGCSNCSTTDFDVCEGVTKDADGYWISCADDEDWGSDEDDWGSDEDSNEDEDWSEDEGSGSESFNSTCLEGMTVLNAPDDQGYELNDVRIATIHRPHQHNHMTDLDELWMQIAECKQCPEWSEADVEAYLKSTLHVLGLLAVVVCVFILVGFSGALVLRRSLAGYQTDSI